MSGPVHRFAVLRGIAVGWVMALFVDILASAHRLISHFVIGSAMRSGVGAVHLWSDFFHRRLNALMPQKVH